MPSHKEAWRSSELVYTIAMNEFLDPDHYLVDADTLVKEHSMLMPSEYMVCHDISNERYHTELISSFSKSQLFHAYDKGMTSYNDVFNLGNKKSLGSGVAFGTLLHDGLEFDGGLEQFVDESQTAPSKYVTSTGTLSQSKAAKEWYAEQTQRVIASGDKDKLMAMWEQLKLNHAVYDLWQNVQHHEVSKVWCRDDGVISRCRDDAITYEGEVIDWKTTRSPQPLKDFPRACIDFGYDFQAAHYLEGQLYTGVGSCMPHGVTFIAMSTVPPYYVEACRIPDDIVTRAGHRITRTLHELTAREEYEEWTPASYGQIHELTFPRWFQQEEI